jgi:hypothetical protein
MSGVLLDDGNAWDADNSLETQKRHNLELGACRRGDA